MLYRNAKIIILIIAFLVIAPLLAVHAARLLYFGETFYPVEILDVLNNPYMGWAPSAEGGPYQQPHRLVYINTTWRELEPQKEEYAFESFEQKYRLSYWKSRNISIILRVNMDSPGKEKHMDIPDWLYEEIESDGIWYDLDYGMGFSPNYSNPKLISYHKKLVEALAVRYNNDRFVPVVALGSIGHWGEWHTKKSPQLSIPFPPVEISNQYVKHYIDSFTNKFLVMRRPFNIAEENGIGLYNDSFGDTEQTYEYFIGRINEGYYDYLAETFQPSMPDYWKHAPSGGEVADPPGMRCFEKSGIENTLQQIRDCHTSWLGPFCPIYYSLEAELQHNCSLTLNTMGYRFVLHAVKHPLRVKTGNLLPVEMIWDNKGVAPFYYEWPVELSISDPDGGIVYKQITDWDIRDWFPGRNKVAASMEIPPDLAAGKYYLCIAILDPDTGKPSIDLAIDNRRVDGRYRLDRIIIPRP